MKIPKQSYIMIVIVAVLVLGGLYYFGNTVETNDMVKKTEINEPVEAEKDEVIRMSYEEYVAEYPTEALLEKLGTSKYTYAETRKQVLAACEDGKCEAHEFTTAAYMAATEGDYKEVEKLAKKNCRQHKTMCEKEIKTRFSGKVVDVDEKPLEGATISFLPDNTSVVTDENGEFSIDVEMYDHIKGRLKIEKEGYMQGFAPHVFDEISHDKNIKRVFTLEKAEGQFSIDTKKETIEGGAVIGGEYVIKTSRSTYTIPKNAFYTEDGKEYKGKLTGYFFEFTRESNLDQVLANDTLNEHKEMIGDFMLSAGMPYVILRGETDELVYISSKVPAKLAYKIQHMDMYKVQINGAKTPLDILNFLIKVSNHFGFIPNTDFVFEEDDMIILQRYPILQQTLNQEYPITNALLQEFVLDYDIPAWLTLDQSNGVWRSEGFKMLNIEGDIETLFYSKIF
ncbi:hypothetical protein COB57_05145 [Candidatus Peregrinibacteria bacterium]|nr:MAG: hypothetical protein COB57_05145 [Candidatus Peregrinibacteria bacterium]